MELMLSYLALCCWIILGLIYFCEFIKEPVQSGELKGRLKRKPGNTIYWLFVLFTLIVCLWPLYLWLRSKWGFYERY